MLSMMSENINQKLFALLDCNNFYVSCERVFQPKLVGRPVVVLSNNDGCAIARSNEAKALGVKMAEPWFKFKHLAKQHGIVTLSSNYALYGDMSARVLDIVMQAMPEVIVYSIDEAFLDLSALKKNFPITKMCQELANNVKQFTGIPVSIGIGTTKTIAKVANYVLKQKKSAENLYYLVDNKELDLVLSKMKLSSIWGIGRRYEEKLNNIGCYTALDFKKIPVTQITQKFNVVLAKTAAELNGNSIIELADMNATRKQIIVSRSFGKPTTEYADIRTALANHLACAAEKLRAERSLAAGIIIFFHGNTFSSTAVQPQNSCYVALAIPSNDTRTLLKNAELGLKSIFKSGFSYKKVGVILQDISSANNKQFDMFAGNQDSQTEPLMQTIDNINKIIGRTTLRFATQCIAKTWEMKAQHKSPDYTSNWQQLVKVYAK